MGPGFSDEPTLPVPRGTSDPREIARRHREGHPSEEVPEKIGPYKVLAYLGGGGMGLVYLAEQSVPSRRVAIKIIPPHRRTKEILARFDIEREALALMDHPNIAKVFDAGESDDGRPYFVMEYVHGISITEYCDKNRLTTNERLALFVEVCRAVHHAHQKGIIHRDIKPGNVLVAIQDDRLIPKVIDFGVAKAVGHHLTQRTIFTERGQLIGTPGYMSPEQAELGALDIDTRTDIYSLGVLLYELLVGAQPFDTHKLLEAGFGEMERVIREVDPPKPSTRLSSMGDDSTVVASNRQTAVRSLSRELRGDLDWITMKCLEKDRTHRYDSATALADDIQRHLRAEPVLAGPPSVIYKLRKFTRRHRFGVAAGTGIAAALIAGFVGTTVQYIRADREWRRAEEKAATATEVSDFIIDLFKVSDPSEALGNKFTARDILERGERRIRGELQTQPLVQAAMMDAIGSVYTNLSLYDNSIDLFENAIAIRRRELSPGHPDLATSLDHLGLVLTTKEKYQEAHLCHLEALASREQQFGRDHPVAAESLIHLASTAFGLGRRDESENLRQEALAICRTKLPTDAPLLAETLMSTGQAAFARGALQDAERDYRESWAVSQRIHGQVHPQTVDALHRVAAILYNQGQYDESEQLYDEALDIYIKLYGPEDAYVAACMNGLSLVLNMQEKYDQAKPMARQALAIDQKKLGPEHSRIASDLNLIGSILRRKGQYEEALAFHRDSLEMRLKLPGDNNEKIGLSRLMLGVCLGKMNRWDEAEKDIQQAIATFELILGPQHGQTQDAYEKIIQLYEAWGKPDEASSYRHRLNPAAPSQR